MVLGGGVADSGWCWMVVGGSRAGLDEGFSRSGLNESANNAGGQSIAVSLRVGQLNAFCIRKACAQKRRARSGRRVI